MSALIFDHINGNAMLLPSSGPQLLRFDISFFDILHAHGKNMMISWKLNHVHGFMQFGCDLRIGRQSTEGMIGILFADNFFELFYCLEVHKDVSSLILSICFLIVVDNHTL